MNNAMDLFESCYSGEDLIKKKATAFDDIAMLFYDRNFGSSSKSEIELRMFSILMDAMIDKYANDNGVLDYNMCSDYNMGKALGIQPSKVTTLKKNKQARYPVNFNWQQSLKMIENNIRYSKEKNKIIIPVRDPNLYIEIKNFIEENGGFIEMQYGSNVIQIRPEYFFLLLYNGVSDETEKAKIRKAFATELKNKNKINDISLIKTDDDVNKIALDLGESTLDVLESLAEGITNPLVGIIKCLKLGAKLLNK